MKCLICKSSLQEYGSICSQCSKKIKDNVQADLNNYLNSLPKSSDHPTFSSFTSPAYEDPFGNLDQYTSQPSKYPKLTTPQQLAASSQDPQLPRSQNRLTRQQSLPQISLSLIRCKSPGCETTFRNNYDCNAHYKAVHLKLKSYKCNECGSFFGVKSTLNRHVSAVHKKKNLLNAHTLNALKMTGYFPIKTT